MPNFTIEDYRIAIKAKYEKEKEEGDYSNNLSSPTPANLRKLCVKRFKSNTDKEDLHAFESFFDFPFDKDKKNLFGDDEMNKLEAVRRFFLGRTENPTEDTIQLAAILVDLRPRPFNKFRKQIDEEDAQLIDVLRDRSATDSGKDVSSDNWSDNVEIENPNDLSPDFVIEESESVQSQKAESIPMSITTTTFSNKEVKPISKKIRYFAIIAILGGLGLIIFFVLSHKGCMQWSGDHFDIVNCDSSNSDNLNKIIPYDENLRDFRKLRVCDTITNYNNLWYSKKDNVVEFFNTHGNNPINGASLKAVTKHIFETYAEKCDLKK